MYSKRPIEDLPCCQIINYLQKVMDENDIIINNASLETYSFKKSFGERLFAFFNIFLAATLLSGFILYASFSTQYKISIMSTIVAATSLALLIYCIDVGAKFSAQYRRQLIYRNLNMKLHIILTNARIFFVPVCCHGYSMVSVRTLQQLIETLKTICNHQKEKQTRFLRVILRDWRSLFVVGILVLVLFVSASVVAVCGFVGVIK